MNRRIETALRSKYNFRKDCSLQNWKETNELCAQGYCIIDKFSAEFNALQRHESRVYAINKCSLSE